MSPPNFGCWYGMLAAPVAHLLLTCAASVAVHLVLAGPFVHELVPAGCSGVSNSSCNDADIPGAAVQPPSAKHAARGKQRKRRGHAARSHSHNQQRAAPPPSTRPSDERPGTHQQQAQTLPSQQHNGGYAAFPYYDEDYADYYEVLADYYFGDYGNEGEGAADAAVGGALWEAPAPPLLPPPPPPPQQPPPASKPAKPSYHYAYDEYGPEYGYATTGSGSAGAAPPAGGSSAAAAGGEGFRPLKCRTGRELGCYAYYYFYEGTCYISPSLIHTQSSSLAPSLSCSKHFCCMFAK